MQEPRIVRARYRDPLDVVWLRAAHELGLRIVRSPDAYAFYDGKGVLLLGSTETLDADDCLAQLIFHELCHAAVAGDDAFHLVDWGLCNQSDRDELQELATLRLQFTVLRSYNLERVLAATTDFRAYYDALCGDVLAEETPEVLLARAALKRMEHAPYAPVVGRALEATRQVHQAVCSVGTSQVSDRDDETLPLLY